MERATTRSPGPTATEHLAYEEVQTYRRYVRLDKRLHLQAFGVTFLHTDLERIIPAEKRISGGPFSVLTPVTLSLEKYLLDVRDSDKARFVEESGHLREERLLLCGNRAHVGRRALLTVQSRRYAEAVRLQYQNGATISQEQARPHYIDDLAHAVNEAEFLNILEHIGVITKAVTGCLDRRNTAGHPNSHTLTEVNVGHCVETLILTVYKRF